MSKRGKNKPVDEKLAEAKDIVEAQLHKIEDPEIKAEVAEAVQEIAEAIAACGKEESPEEDDSAGQIEPVGEKPKKFVGFDPCTLEKVYL